MQVAQAQVDEASKLSAEAERKLAEAKVMEVERMSQHVTSMENNEEEEVPDAYLREDWSDYPDAATQNKQFRYSAFSFLFSAAGVCVLILFLIVLCLAINIKDCVFFLTLLCCISFTL